MFHVKQWETRNRKRQQTKMIFDTRPSNTGSKVTLPTTSQEHKSCWPQFTAFHCSSQDSILHSWTCRHNSNAQPPPRTTPMPKTNTELHPWRSRGNPLLNKTVYDCGIGHLIYIPESFGMTYWSVTDEMIQAISESEASGVRMPDASPSVQHDNPSNHV